MGCVLNRTTIIGLCGLLLILAALGLNSWFNSDVSNDDTLIGQTSPSTETPPQETVTERPSTGTIASDDEKVDNVTPNFDVVRVSKEGDTVIAGRAEAGSTVVIMDGKDELGRVVADDAGEWVYLPDRALETGNRELSLRSENTEGDVRESKNMVLLAVPEKNTDGELSDQQPLALLVPKEGGSSTVLQKPSTSDGVEAETGGLAIDNIDYDDAGNVTITGRGASGATVRGYLNNALLHSTTVNGDKVWVMKPTKLIEPGVYNLRLDQLVNNIVVSRLEIPFNRAEPITNLGAGNFIIVQPGTSLWRIARRTLGDGFGYTIIYDANKEQIKNPDLIYPGQVFQIPSSSN